MSFVNPVFLLAAMGLGVGTLVDTGEAAGDVGGDYLSFLAPGLLVAVTVQLGAVDATYPVMGAVKWNRTYFAMVATPLRVIDVIVGHLAYIGLRLALTAVVFLVVAAGFGAFESPWAALVAPVGVLAGLAAWAPVAAWSVTVERETSYANLQRYVITPMTLFAGTFFPVDQLPAALRPVAWLTPLWHGTELARWAADGASIGLAPLGHTAYLSAFVAAGVAAGTRTYARRLMP